MTTVTAAVLAGRVRARGMRMSDRLAVETLRCWQARGVAEETFPGGWRLTLSGMETFPGGWAVGLDDDDGQEHELDGEGRAA